MTLGLIFVLLVVMQLKHFLADYPLQGEYMLQKFDRRSRVWVPALAAHAGVHALFTLLIVSFVVGTTPSGWVKPLPVLLALLDFAVHFVMDRVKASPNLLGRFKPLDADGFRNMKSVIALGSCGSEMFERARSRLWGNRLFWWSLGLDQLVHHLTHYAIIACLLLSR